MAPTAIEVGMHRQQQIDALRAEIGKLFDYLQKVKLEIASIKHPRSQIDQFGKVADQLATIVAATEDATNTIMEASEAISSVVAEMDEMVRYPEAIAHHEQVTEAVNRIFEACSFQDITGQRISKIIKTMNLIEGTINSLIVIVGSNEVVLPIIQATDEPLKHDNGVGLYGPSAGVSQEDIDKLFG